MADDDVELTDQEKLDLRSGLSRVVGALMRAWRLGMFSAGTPKERELLSRIREIVGGPVAVGEADETPLGVQVPPDPNQTEGLVPIADGEFLEVFDDLVLRYKRMEQAYGWGMITATTSEQMRQLAELQELLD